MKLAGFGRIGRRYPDRIALGVAFRMVNGRLVAHQITYYQDDGRYPPPETPPRMPDL